MGNSHLMNRFADAGLRLRLAEQPIARALGAEVVFQMDIRRTRAWDPHSEYYVACFAIAKWTKAARRSAAAG